MRSDPDKHDGPPRVIDPVVNRAVARAANRAALARSIGRTGWALLFSGVSVILLASADRVWFGFLEQRLGAGWWPWVLLLVPAVTAAIVIVWTFATAPRGLSVAVDADNRLGLQDAVPTAMSIGPAHADPAMSELIAEQGRALAGSLDARSAYPIRLGWRWMAAPVLALASVGVGMFVPARIPPPGTEPIAAGPEEATIERRTQETIEKIRSALDDDGLDAESDEFRESIDDLERRLSAGELSDEEKAGEAIEAADRAAELMESRADRAEEVERRRRAELESLEGEEFGAAEELAEALRDGRFDEAADLLESLDPDSMAERESIAEDLERLSERLEEAAGEPSFEETPAEQGTPGASEPGEQNRELAEQLRQAAEDIASREDSGAGEENEPPMDAANEDASQQGDRPDANPPQDRPASDPQGRDAEDTPDAGESDGSQQPGERTETAPSGSPQPSPDTGENSQQQQQQQQQGAGEQPASQESADQERGGESQSGDQQNPSEQRPGTEGGSQSSENGAQPEPGGAGQGESDSESPGQSGEGAARPEAQPGREAQDAEGGEGGTESSGSGQGAGSGEGGVSEMVERLREMQRESDSIQEQRQRAEELRRQADDLMDELDPERREELERLAEMLAAEQDAPGTYEAESEVIDGRGETEVDESGRVIGRWYRDAEGGGESREPGAPAGVMQEAVEGVERAIEQQRVPRRHRELVRRVFERYAERLSEEPAEPTEGAPVDSVDSDGDE